MKTKTKFKKTEIGMIPEDWEVSNFEYACDKIIDCSHAKKPNFLNIGEYIYLEVSNVGDDGFLNLEEKKFISKEDFNAWTKRLVPKKDDIVITKTGRVGASSIIHKDINCCIGRNQVILRADRNKVEPHFLWHFLRSSKFKEELKKQTMTGTILESLHVKYISKLNTPLPSLPEQQKIISFLDAISYKIKLLQKQNETLEKIGQAIFKHWFVDFEFPNKEGKPYKSSGGKMVESELGEIPEGWSTHSLDNIANFLNGLALQKYPPKGDNDLPAIKIRELKQGITDATDYANNEIPEQYIVKNGDILFSWSGSLEIAIWSLGKGALNQHLFKVTSDKFNKWFYYYWTHYYLRIFRGIAESKATTMGHIKREHLRESKVLVPDDACLKTMDPIMQNLIDKQIANKIQILSLQKTRDLLLPKLMTGKIRVPLEVKG